VRQVTALVIHCAATPNGKPIPIETIDRWHKERGFQRSANAMSLFNPHLSSVGYHFVIGVDGKVDTGRDVEEIGAHVAGSNAKSVGVCMVGTDKYTPAQWSALAGLAGTLRQMFPNAVFHGHRDYSPDKDGDGVIEPWEWTKTCPGFDVTAWAANDYTPKDENVLTE
jgi:N-acetylmuramoyl-L-alanine amidase